MKIESSPLPQPATQEVENPALRQVSRQFEAMFNHQLISAMRKTVVKDGFFKESHAEKVYQGMLDYEHAQRVAETEQLGLSKLVYEHLLRMHSAR